MIAQLHVESPDSQVSAHEVLIRIEPTAQPYYFAVDCASASDDVASDAIMEDVVRRYRDAWEKLAEM